MATIIGLFANVTFEVDRSSRLRKFFVRLGLASPKLETMTLEEYNKELFLERYKELPEEYNKITEEEA